MLDEHHRELQNRFRPSRAAVQQIQCPQCGAKERHSCWKTKDGKAAFRKSNHEERIAALLDDLERILG